MISYRSRSAAAAVFFLALTTGCSTHRAASTSVEPSAPPSLALVSHVDVAGALAREPMIVETPSGVLFASGYGDPGPKLWKSADRGATWTRVNVGTEAEGAIGNSDVDLAVARDGTIYFVSMAFDRSVGQGTEIAIGVSHDVGATWHWSSLSKVRFVDRPWVAVAPDGTVHVIWNDGHGVAHAVSRDAGATWIELSRVTTVGGSSHLAVGPHGELAVRIAPISASGNKFDSGVDRIAVSTNGGATWTNRPAPGEREWAHDTADAEPIPRWVEPLAWDSTGGLYSLWTNRGGLWLAESRDQGNTWRSWQLISGGAPRYYPYLIARGRGHLAATWSSGSGDSLQAQVAVIDVRGGDAPPVIVQAAPFTPDSWGLSSRHENPKVRQTAGEYLAVTFLAGGGVAVVTPLQNESAGRFGFSFWRFELH